MLCAAASQASTTTTTMDQTSQPSSSTTVRLGGRAIDRHNPIIRDGRRLTPPPSPNPNSQSSSTYHTPLKTRLGLESSDQKRVTKKKTKKSDYDGVKLSKKGTPQGSSRCLLSNPVLFDGFVDSDPIQLNIEPEITTSDGLDNFHDEQLVINASKYLSPSSSSFSFLEKKQHDFFDGFLDYDPVLSPDNPFSEPTIASPRASYSSLEDKDVSSSPNFKYSPPQAPPPPPPLSPPPHEKTTSSDPVVVLRVSLHCKGCAGKVKKHLSKLKGVTSFNVDFAAKKVTVTGDVTPLTVLASISKVKNAQFWPEIIQQ